MNANEQKLPISRRIRAWMQEGEDILTSLLGLIIAISGLIAFADVFSSGRALAVLPWLLWVWIISQAIAVDYQFYITVKRQFTASNVDPFVYWARWVLIAVLGLLIVFIGAIFAVHETGGGEISTSMQVLGIPSIAFMYARAVAPVLLLFVIGIDHALDRKDKPIPGQVAEPAPVQQAQPNLDELLTPLIERLEEMHARRTEAIIEQVTRVTIEQVTSPRLPAIAPPLVRETSAHNGHMVDSIANDQQIYQDPEQLRPNEQAIAWAKGEISTTEYVARTTGDDQQPIYPARFASKEREIAAILARRPDATPEEVAQAANCSPRTASKWIEKLRVQQ